MLWVGSAGEAVEDAEPFGGIGGEVNEDEVGFWGGVIGDMELEVEGTGVGFGVIGDEGKGSPGLEEVNVLVREEVDLVRHKAPC